jgi:hypothetical protein
LSALGFASPVPKGKTLATDMQEMRDFLLESSSALLIGVPLDLAAPPILLIDRLLPSY